MRRSPAAVAVLPAAGAATRLGGLARGEKAALAVFRDAEGRLAPAASCALASLYEAGVREARLVVPPSPPGATEGPGAARSAAAGGSRLVEALGERFWPPELDPGRGLAPPPRVGGARQEVRGEPMRLVYLPTAPTPSATHSLVLALQGVAEDRSILLAFPDILFRPRSIFRTVRETLADGTWDVVLGCLPAERPEKTDMVAFDGQGRLTDLVIKQPDCGLRYTWQMAAWTPRFTELLRGAVRAADESAGDARGAAELHVGAVLLQAREAGLRVGCVPFPRGVCLDIGTPEDLARATDF